jgi:hypothetical protein
LIRISLLTTSGELAIPRDSLNPRAGQGGEVVLNGAAMKADRCAITLVAFFCLCATVSSADAEIRVRIDIPFVNDPQVNGTRVSVDFVANPDDFIQCKTPFEIPGLFSPFFTWAYQWRTGGIET